jgi:hypothetical protein
MDIKKILLIILTCLTLGACGNDSLWDEMSAPISKFVSTYYPLQGISSYSESDGIYYVTVKNGATITFNSSYQWLSINGNGQPLPNTFIENELEPKIIQYLMALELTDQVYAAQNDPREVILSLLNYKIRYVKETGDISEVK